MGYPTNNGANADSTIRKKGKKIMRHFSRLCLLLAITVAAAALPAFSQQVKGDSELGLSGSLFFNHSSPHTTNGQADMSYGYYFKKNDQAGFDTVTNISNQGSATDLSVYLQGRYRHLFPIKSNPMFYPFAGVKGGLYLDSPAGQASTTKVFVGTGEAGFKQYISKKTALEVAYNFLYMNLANSDFAHETSSQVTFGFTYTFGGPKSKH